MRLSSSPKFLFYAQEPTLLEAQAFEIYSQRMLSFLCPSVFSESSSPKAMTTESMLTKWVKEPETKKHNLDFKILSLVLHVKSHPESQNIREIKTNPRG